MEGVGTREIRVSPWCGLGSVLCFLVRLQGCVIRAHLQAKHDHWLGYCTAKHTYAYFYFYFLREAHICIWLFQIGKLQKNTSYCEKNISFEWHVSNEHLASSLEIKMLGLNLTYWESTVTRCLVSYVKMQQKSNE